MIAIGLSKQQALGADEKAMQQISLTWNLEWDEITTIFFIIDEAKDTILDFSQSAMRVLQFYFALISYQDKMTQYNTLNVKLPNSQLNKLKSGIKNGTDVTIF